MVNCVIYKCNNRSKNKPGDTDYAKVGFYSIPKVIDSQCARTAEMTAKRRAEWFRRIRRADLDESATHYKVCGKHFISGRPAYVMNDTDPDWAPCLHLGYDENAATPAASLGRYKIQKARRASRLHEEAASSANCGREETVGEQDEAVNEEQAEFFSDGMHTQAPLKIPPPAETQDFGQSVTMESLAALEEENRRLLSKLGSTKAQLSTHILGSHLPYFPESPNKVSGDNSFFHSSTPGRASPGSGL